MSTKTSIKRIALVAVSALGFGLLSAYSPASAAISSGDKPVNVSVTLDTATTTFAGRVGQQVSIPVTARVNDNLITIASAGQAFPVLQVATAMTSQPATSTVYPTLTSATLAIGSALTHVKVGASSAASTLVSAAAVATAVSDAGTASHVATLNYTGDVQTDNFKLVAQTRRAVGTVTFTPTVAGTYTLTVWNETSRLFNDATGASWAGVTLKTAGEEASLSGAESYQTFTINVSTGVSSVTLTPKTTSVPIKESHAGMNGALIMVSLKDASGNAAVLSPGEAVVLTPTGTGDISAVNGGTVTSAAGAAYSLSSSDFNSSGIAWVNMTDETEGTTSLTASINGGNTVSTSISFGNTTAVAAAPTKPSTVLSGFAGTSPNFEVPLGASSFTWAATISTGSAAGFTVTETTNSAGVGHIHGYTTALSYDQRAVSAAGVASISVSATTTVSGTVAYYIGTDDENGTMASGDDNEGSLAGVTNAPGTISINPSIVNSAVGATNTLTATVKDRYGVAYPYQTVSATVSGKNPVTIARTAVTDAAGQVSFAFTDANTNTAVSDIVTMAISGGSSTTAQITYGTNAVSKVTLEYPGDADTVAGTTTTGINTAATGATGTAASVTAIITGSTGALLAGVPVTFAVSGLTGAEVHTTLVTVYTDTTGEATTSISSYAAGKATVTATAGGVSSTADIYFKQATATAARTISASAAGGVVTATVKDRYGNPIEGVTVNATRTGTGFFGSGASTSSGTTDKNGKVEFIVSGDATVTVAFTSIDYGQSDDLAGYVGTTAVTASTAGTATANQKGLGAALAPAGVNTATATVVGAPNAAAVAAEAASDAAAEAIDAANAATDAANLAAEAADAATVAAEEARDAADAATAAVEELATQVATLMAALKAQITTLANTVAKIAKKVKA